MTYSDLKWGDWDVKVGLRGSKEVLFESSGSEKSTGVYISSIFPLFTDLSRISDPRLFTVFNAYQYAYSGLARRRDHNSEKTKQAVSGLFADITQLD